MSLEKETYLFIWSRGGGGHKAVMEAKMQELEERGDYEFIALDMMGEEFLNSLVFPIIGKMGDFAVSIWNDAQKAGDVRKQKIVSSLQWLAEIVFTPFVYRRMRRFLLSRKTPLKGIIVTQALCNAGIASAIRTVNRKRGWNMRLDLWMSDLPTEKAIHFFYSIRKIGRSQSLSDLVTLYSPPPYAKDTLIKGKEFDWWQKWVGKVRVITDQPYPIRKAFLDQPSLIGKAVHLQLRSAGQKPLCFHIEGRDKVATLMLGSQPSVQAVLDYVDVMIKLSIEEDLQRKKQKMISDTRYYFFVFCGTGLAKDYLISEVRKRTVSPNFPLFLTIVPFSLQTDQELAPLLARSDVTLTRSGGATSMELMHLNREKKGLTLIHSEGAQRGDRLWSRLVDKLVPHHKKGEVAQLASSKEPLARIHLVEPSFVKKETPPPYKRNFRSFFHDLEGQFVISPGIFLWEAGNAEYLKQKIEAQIVTPKHVETILQTLFFREAVSSGPSRKKSAR